MPKGKGYKAGYGMHSARRGSLGANSARPSHTGYKHSPNNKGGEGGKTFGTYTPPGSGYKNPRTRSAGKMYGGKSYKGKM